MKPTHLIPAVAMLVPAVAVAVGPVSSGDASTVIPIMVEVPAKVPLVHNVHELAPALLSGLESGTELVVECTVDDGSRAPGVSVLRLTTPGDSLRPAMVVDGAIHHYPKTFQAAPALDSMLMVPPGEAGEETSGSCQLPWVVLNWTVRYVASRD